MDSIKPRIQKLVLIIMGISFGFPLGCMIPCKAYQKHYITKYQCLWICICTNAFSPMFLRGYVFQCLNISDKSIQALYFICCYLLPILFLIGVLTKKEPQAVTQKNTASRFQFNMKIIDAGILNGFRSLIKLCGYMVVCRIALGLLSELFASFKPLSAFLLPIEISNGIWLLSQMTLTKLPKIVLSIGLLQSTCLCGVLQSISILTDNHISVKGYLLGRIFLSIFMMAITWLILSLFN